MRSWLVLSFAMWCAAASTAWGVSATLSIRPSVLSGAPGSLLDVPVYISSPDQISIIRMTLEYDATVGVYQSVRLGSDAQAANFSIAAVNPNLSFAPKTPGTNENLLILAMSGTSTWITGTNKQLVILTFQLTPTACKNSPLNFDSDCNHTDGSSFQGDYLCGASLQLRSGVMANGCTTDAGAPTPRFTLLPNIPNPFNPNTTIGLDVAAAEPVCLQVFGVDGDVVRVLLDAVVPAGHHEAIWDGRDAHGRRMPSGVYYYQLRVGDAVVSRPMVLIK